MVKPLAAASDRSLSGTALVRIDVNAADNWRLEAVLPTIEYVADRAKKTVIISHKGRPVPGKRLGALSLGSDADKLANLTDRHVWFLTGTSIPEVRRKLDAVPDGDIAMLENIRAFRGEANDSESFAKSLASLGDYYVSDAFPVLHHPAASVTGLPRLMPSYAGFQLIEEMDRLGKLNDRVRRPYVVVIGGAKAKDKLGVLSACIERADKVLVGGACANALLALSGVNVGKSLYERDAKLLAELKPYVGHKKIVLPVDFTKSGGKILDLGPKSAKLFAKHVAGAGTVLWTGPLGYIEKKRFAKSSLAVAKAVARNKKSFSVTGGGETVTFLKANKLDRGFSFLSTGGGAMIDFVSGHELPGLSALAGKGKSKRTAAEPKAGASPREVVKVPKLAPVYDVFFHDDFDGRASAAVFLDFLKSRGSKIGRFIPVEHDLKETWIKSNALDLVAGTKKRNPAIVVDFPYHPQAAFWYDHHPTAFRLPEWQKAFQQTPFKRLDASYPSACHLVIDALDQEFGYVPPAHIKELGKWLDVVDGARYDNPFQTIALREPALQIDAYLGVVGRSTYSGQGGREPVLWLIEALAKTPLSKIAKDPRVQEALASVKDETRQSLSFYRRNLKVKGGVGVIDTTDLTTRRLRYAPYYIAPHSVFAVTVTSRGESHWIVMVGVNPWKRDRSSFDIGALLTRFGGGGHPYAGAVELKSRADVDRVTDYFVSLFNG